MRKYDWNTEATKSILSGLFDDVSSKVDICKSAKILWDTLKKLYGNEPSTTKPVCERKKRNGTHEDEEETHLLVSSLIEVEHLTDRLSSLASLSHAVATNLVFNMHVYTMPSRQKDIQNFGALGFLNRPRGKPNPIRSPSRDCPLATDHLSLPIALRPEHVCPIWQTRHLLWFAHVKQLWSNHVDSFTNPNQHLDARPQSWSHQIRSLSSDQSRAALFFSRPVKHAININVNQSPPTSPTTLHWP